MVSVLKKNTDPEFTSDKLMEIGVYEKNKNQCNSLLYDWENCLLPHIKSDPKYREISNSLLEAS